MDLQTSGSLFFAKATKNYDQFSLTNLAVAFNDPLAALILLCLISGTIFMLFMMHGKSVADPCLIVLSTLSGLIGKAVVPPSRNSTSLVYYAGWLMLTGFISMTYTNVLQSIVVVPAIRYNGLTFEEMIDRNFAFHSVDLQFITDLAHDPDTFTLEGKQGSVLFKEKLLRDRLVGEGGQNNITVSNNVYSWREFMEQYSEASRVTRVVDEDQVAEYHIISEEFGFDVIVGKDKFFNLPLLWSFEFVERGSLLIASFKRVQQTGSVSYFLHLSDSKRWQNVRAGLQEDLQEDLFMSCKSSKAKCNAKGGDSENAAVTLHDSLVTESFTLLLYGQTAAVLVFVFETFVQFTIYIG